MSIKDLTIVITSFRSEKAIRECLKHINKDCKVINIENSDNKQYKNNIEKDFDNVKCILTGDNLGYAKANNIGLKNTKTKYALVLNPDTKLTSTTLENFFHSSKKNPDFAMIGPTVTNSSSEKNISNSNTIKVVKSIKGHAMFLNLSHFKEVGFFDENFFIYLEEIDLCRRLRNSGKKIYIDPNIKVFHEGGKSHDESINFEMELSRNWHWMWSSFYFNKKYRGFLISLIDAFPKLFSSIFKFLIFSIIKNKDKKEIYYQRFSGLINAIMGKNSWYRPKV